MKNERQNKITINPNFLRISVNIMVATEDMFLRHLICHAQEIGIGGEKGSTANLNCEQCGQIWKATQFMFIMPIRRIIIPSNQKVSGVNRFGLGHQKTTLFELLEFILTIYLGC
jgi:hypothetical protein